MEFASSVLQEATRWFRAAAGSRRPPLAHTLRVNQLDAGRLDDEISGLLAQHFTEVFDFWGTLPLQRLQPELQAFLRAALWRFTIWEDAPTPGCRLQNLTYGHAASVGVTPSPLTRGQKVAFLAVSAVLPWLSLRLREAAELLESRSGANCAAGRRRAVWACWPAGA